MIRTKKRLMLCFCLIGFNVLFIWGNSLLPREISSAFSRFIGRLLNFFMSGTEDLSSGEGQGTLRKIAHFAEFCCLGVLLSWAVRMLREKKWELWIYPIAIGVLVAVVDETIQYFIPGRGPGLRDVAIDSSGVLLGILLFVGIQAIRKKKDD